MTESSNKEPAGSQPSLYDELLKAATANLEARATPYFDRQPAQSSEYILRMSERKRNLNESITDALQNDPHAAAVIAESHVVINCGEMLETLLDTAVEEVSRTRAATADGSALSTLCEFKISFVNYGNIDDAQRLVQGFRTYLSTQRRRIKQTVKGGVRPFRVNVVSVSQLTESLALTVLQYTEDLTRSAMQATLHQHLMLHEADLNFKPGRRK